MKPRLAILALLTGIGAAVLCFLLLYRVGLPLAQRPPRIQSGSTLLLQVQSLAQLVTVKYVLERVVILEDVKWYGENRVLLVAHGVVKAGVNLQQLTPADIDLRGTNVVVRLPRPEITDAYLDDQRTRVIERTTGFLRSFDKELEQEARRQAVDDVQRAARTSGILKDADDRARLQLTVLFRQLGLEVQFE